jgi:hypothetical protein
MKSFFITVLLFFSPMSLADDIVYILTSEFFVGQGEGIVTEQDKWSENKKLGNDLLKDYSIGYSIDGNFVYRIIGGEKYGVVGSVKKCDGYGGECLVIDNLISIFIPNDISNGKVLNWEWGEYKYESSITRKHSILGVDLDIIEIFGVCDSCHFRNVWLSLDLSYGLVSFTLKSEIGFLGYTLSGRHGFLSKSM